MRVLSTRGGAVRVVARQGSGEESNVELCGAFARDNQSGTFFYVEGAGYRGGGCAQSAPAG